MHGLLNTVQLYDVASECGVYSWQLLSTMDLNEVARRWNSPFSKFSSSSEAVVWSLRVQQQQQQQPNARSSLRL